MTPLRFGLIIAALLAVLAALAELPRPNEPGSAEYRVYRSLLAEATAASPGPMVVHLETREVLAHEASALTTALVRQHLAGLEPGVELRDGVIQSYVEANQSAKQLELTRLDLASAHGISPQRFLDLFPESSPADAWPAFRTAFGEGAYIVHVSRVGFASDGSQALVSLSTTCGDLCGRGSYFVLNGSPGGWTVAAASVAWFH